MCLVTQSGRMTVRWSFPGIDQPGCGADHPLPSSSEVENGFELYFRLPGGRNSAVGIATGYELDGSGIESHWGRDFPHSFRPSLGFTQPAVQ
jgi:hypothetical protein